jgi:hypothetical protein
MVGPVPPRANRLRALDQLRVVRLQPEAAGLLEVDARAQTGTTSGASTSMNELTEKTALPAPGLP